MRDQTLAGAFAMTATARRARAHFQVDGANEHGASGSDWRVGTK